MAVGLDGVCHQGHLELVKALLAPSGGRGEMACRILAVHVSSSCTASSARTLVHIAHTVPQVRAVPNEKRKVFGTLECQRDDTSASVRRVSFKLVRPSSSRNRARAGVSSMLTVEYSPRGYDGHNCPQRVMVNGEQDFQAMRPSDSRWGGQSPRYRETHGTGGHRGNAGTMVLSH